MEGDRHHPPADAGVAVAQPARRPASDPRLSTRILDMSATLQRPPTSAVPAGEPPRGTAAFREDLLMVATLALLVTACLPLARVYVGLAFLRPVYGAVLLALGLAWGARRLGAGPVGSLLVSIAGWVAFVSAAFLSDTLFAGVVPTGRTV